MRALAISLLAVFLLGADAPPTDAGRLRSTSCSGNGDHAGAEFREVKRSRCSTRRRDARRAYCTTRQARARDLSPTRTRLLLAAIACASRTRPARATSTCRRTGRAPFAHNLIVQAQDARPEAPTARLSAHAGLKLAPRRGAPLIASS
jgi:hypothetical protein